MGGFPNLRKTAIRLLEALLPPACPFCGQTLQTEDSLFCSTCRVDIRPLPPGRCNCCALPFQGLSDSPHLCGRCSVKPPAFQKVFAVGLYEGTLRQAIHKFKFSDRIGLDVALARLLNQGIAEDEHFDLIVPVPLSRKGLRQRGYNQSLLLARQVGRFRKTPVAERLLAKVRETEPQHALSAREREKNLHGAFALRGTVADKRVLLVDDVMTTGATLEACSLVLVGGGAREVRAAVVGRAV